MNETSTCSNCRFWKPRDEQPGTGKCKYGPPIWVRPNRPGDFSAAAWPTTPANEFCFRWESYLPAKVVTAGATEVLAARSEGTVPAVEPPPVEEVKAASTKEVLNPEFENKDNLPSAFVPGPAATVLNVGPEPVAQPLATNQIAQLVRGKRQPGQRME